MIDNELTETLQDRAAAIVAPDLAGLFDGIERRGVRRARRRIAGAALATVAVVGAVTGIAVSLHGSSSGSRIPPAKHTNSPSPTSPHVRIKVTSTVALDPAPRLSEATGTPIVAEAPDGTVVYASGPGIWQARSAGRSYSISGGDAPVIALAASNDQVVALTRDQIVVTTVLHTPNTSNGAGGSAEYQTFPTPGASTSAPINDGGVAVEGDIAYVWDRHNDHGNPPATLSRIDLATGTSTVVDHWLTPGDVYADQDGVYYQNESDGPRLARVGPTGPPQLAARRGAFTIFGFYDNALVGERSQQQKRPAWYVVDPITLRTEYAGRTVGVLGRLTQTTSGVLSLVGMYPCYGPSGYCTRTSIHYVNTRPRKFVDFGHLTLPQTELLLSGGPPAAIVANRSATELVRLAVSDH